MDTLQSITEAREGTGVKVLHVLAILLTTLVTTFLLSRQTYLYGGAIVDVVKQERASLQILVQVLSHGLALLQIYALRTLFNFASRLYLQRRTISLESLAFWTALSNAQVDWSLSLGYMASSLMVVGLFIVPGGLWAGALSPILTTSLQLQGTMNVSAFSLRTANIWDIEFYTVPGQYMLLWNYITQCPKQIHDQRGFIPACPVPALQGLLLLSVSSATTIDGEPRLHSKLDNSQWTYVGRSYGMGSSIALTEPLFPPHSGSASMTSTYEYNETGYLSTVTCIKNSTSAFSFGLEAYGVGDDGIAVYHAAGPLPNEPQPDVHEYYPVTSFHNTSENLLAWAARSIDGVNMIAVASGLANYTNLNQTQCEVVFTPATFNVAVNTTDKSISVQHIPFSERDLEPTGRLTANVMDSVNLLARMSNTLYVSVLGNALSLNVLNMQERLNRSVADDDIVTSAVADSFAAVIDDLLVAYGASQVVIAQDTTPTPVLGLTEGVRIGEPVYVYAIFVLNVAIIIVMIVEALRNSAWRGLLKFDYTSVKTLIVSSSAGGSEVARAVSEQHRDTDAQEWLGNPRDTVFRHVQVGLTISESVPGMFAIRPLHQDATETPHVAWLPVRQDGDSHELHLIRRKPITTIHPSPTQSPPRPRGYSAVGEVR